MLTAGAPEKVQGNTYCLPIHAFMVSPPPKPGMGSIQANA